MTARRSLCVTGLLTAAALLAAAQTADAQTPGAQTPGAKTSADDHLRIVSAVYGTPRAAHALDFSQRLQQTCGDHAVACQSFCASTLTGAAPGFHIPFTGRPVCRIVYRCGERLTRATETDQGDIIALSCRPDRP